MKTAYIFYGLITIFLVSITPVISPKNQNTAETTAVTIIDSTKNWRDSVELKRDKLFVKEENLKQMLSSLQNAKQ